MTNGKDRFITVRCLGNLSVVIAQIGRQIPAPSGAVDIARGVQKGSFATGIDMADSLNAAARRHKEFATAATDAVWSQVDIATRAIGAQDKTGGRAVDLTVLCPQITIGNDIGRGPDFTSVVNNAAPVNE